MKNWLPEILIVFVFILAAITGSVPDRDDVQAAFLSDDEDRRADAVEYVGKTESKDWSASVATLLLDEEKDVRKEAARALERIRDPRVHDELIAALIAGKLKEGDLLDILERDRSSDAHQLLNRYIEEGLLTDDDSNELRGELKQELELWQASEEVESVNEAIRNVIHE